MRARCGDTDWTDQIETLKQCLGMLWGERLRVFTDHQNINRDALGMTSNHGYYWSLMVEEYGHVIVYIKGVHNTVADAINGLDYDPMVNLEHHSHIMQHMGAETGIRRSH